LKRSEEGLSSVLTEQITHLAYFADGSLPEYTDALRWCQLDLRKEAPMDADEINLVRITTDDLTRQLWAAATPRGQAVDRVLDVVPEGWCAFLLDASIEPWMKPDLSHMSYGEVRELTVAKKPNNGDAARFGTSMVGGRPT
jgi:hypothetical protein